MRMPATIQDAIALCSHLDIQYLWVDRLCIVQDDQAHKHSQITAMDQIYSSAILTICAAAGDDANAGLLGLEVSPRHFQQCQHFTSALEIIPMLPAYEHFKLTKWASRGWTYQEQFLSKRILLFTPWQIFFHCSKGALAEGLSDRWMPLMDQEDDCPSPPSNSDGEQPDADSDHRFASYMEHVENYNHRSLTYPSDVHNAFAGIYKSLYRTLASSLASLPGPHLDRALLWTHAPSTPAATRQTTTAAAALPSWSWTHLSTRITYKTPPSSPLLDRNRLFGSLVAWRDATDTLLPPSPSLTSWTPPPPTLPSLVATWPNRLRRTGNLSGFSPALSRLYVHAAAALGCCRAEGAALGTRPWTWMAVQAASARRWPGGHGEWWRDAVAAGGEERDEGGWTEEALGPGRLGCRAGVVWVRVEEVGGREDELVLLRDGEGRAVGTAAVPGGLAALGGREEARVFAAMALSVTDADGELLDRLFEADPGLGAVERGRDGERTEASPDVTVRDGEGVPLVPPPALNVMMLGWRGEVAHRIAIGKVLLTRWAGAGPQFRNVVLE
ncbi:hypothetical protein GTA08_BOTSDO11049 [Neofusicoccum parvum]|nr:hypothetical protein GTA08_BOTSDO11049 [Neofusicoccum parvum]